MLWLLLCLFSVSRFPPTLGVRLICDEQSGLISKIRDDLGRIDQVKYLNQLITEAMTKSMIPFPKQLTSGEWTYVGGALRSDSACVVKISSLQCILDELSLKMSSDFHPAQSCFLSAFNRFIFGVHNLVEDPSLNSNLTSMWLSVLHGYLFYYAYVSESVTARIPSLEVLNAITATASRIAKRMALEITPTEMLQYKSIFHGSIRGAVAINNLRDYVSRIPNFGILTVAYYVAIGENLFVLLVTVLFCIIVLTFTLKHTKVYELIFLSCQAVVDLLIVPLELVQLSLTSNTCVLRQTLITDWLIGMRLNFVMVLFFQSFVALEKCFQLKEILENKASMDKAKMRCFRCVFLCILTTLLCVGLSCFHVVSSQTNFEFTKELEEFQMKVYHITGYIFPIEECEIKDDYIHSLDISLWVVRGVLILCNALAFGCNGYSLFVLRRVNKPLAQQSESHCHFKSNSLMLMRQVLIDVIIVTIYFMLTTIALLMIHENANVGEKIVSYTSDVLNAEIYVMIVWPVLILVRAFVFLFTSDKLRKHAFSICKQVRRWVLCQRR